MHKNEERNRNNNYNSNIPDYSSKVDNAKESHPNKEDNYNEFAKELNPDDFE